MEALIDIHIVCAQNGHLIPFKYKELSSDDEFEDSGEMKVLLSLKVSEGD